MPEPEHQSPPVSEARPPGEPSAPGQSPWAYPVMWIAIVLILVAGMVYVFKSCLAVPGEALDKSGQLAAQLAHDLQKVAAAFKQGTLTTTFTSYATSISGNEYFQFATLNQVETFTRKDESTVAFGYIPLPDVIVQATAPVTYTYYLDLNERWEFRLEHGVVYVTAPDIKFNKPAVDASRITYEVKKDSLIRNTTDAVASLKTSITGLSYQKARTNIELVREKGRQQTEAFVQNWLARSFADGKVYAVKVRFRDEERNPGNGASGQPTENGGPAINNP